MNEVEAMSLGLQGFGFPEVRLFVACCGVWCDRRKDKILGCCLEAARGEGGLLCWGTIVDRFSSMLWFGFGDSYGFQMNRHIHQYL